MTIRILIVDDEDDIREIVGLSLGLDPEFEMTACCSGAEALEEVRRRAPDLILLDVMMPGMDGPATLKALRAAHDDQLCPVVFCTARTQKRDRQSYLDFGACGVIAKPFDPMTLAQTVRGFLR